MTKREYEVLELIRKNPLISQNEIARELGITRSAVSVYIGNLIKCGKMQGRGYILSKPEYHVIIGAANFDFIGILDFGEEQSIFSSEENEHFLGTENEIQYNYGGTAKNVADYLVRLGSEAKLIAAIAGDVFGNEILKECHEHGISTEACLFNPYAQTSMYLELRSRKRFLYTGLANMAIEQQITPEYLETKRSVLNGTKSIVLDDGVPAQTAEYLTSLYGNTKDVYLLSTSKMRINPFNHLIGRFRTLLISYSCAVELAGQLAGVDMRGRHVTDILEQIIAGGAQEVVFLFEHTQICYANRTECMIFPSRLSDATGPERGQGSREAMMAGMIYARSQGCSISETITIMSAMKEIAYETIGVLNKNVCVDLLESILEKTGTLSPFCAKKFD